MPHRVATHLERCVFMVNYVKVFEKGFLRGSGILKMGGVLIV